MVGTPGSGFGPSGETYFRLTAFGSYENTVEAVDRIKKAFPLEYSSDIVLNKKTALERKAGEEYRFYGHLFTATWGN